MILLQRLPWQSRPEFAGDPLLRAPYVEERNVLASEPGQMLFIAGGS